MSETGATPISAKSNASSSWTASVLVAAIPALLPVVSLRELHIGAAELGLLYTSMGAGSVITAAFILPWARARYSPNNLTKLAAYLLAIVMLLLAFVRQTQLYL